MFRKDLLLLSVLSFVFLAGCTGGGDKGATGAGVIITSFAPDVQQIDPDSSVTFTTAIKNIGGKEATKIKALFFGLSDEWKIGDTSFADPSSKSKLVKTLSTLAMADQSTGLSGEEATFDWDLTFPKESRKNDDITYDASVSIFYNYMTESNVLLRFAEANYLKTNPNVPRGVVSSSSSAGPLVITAVARTPSVSATAATGRVQFEIQNVGSGRVIKTVDPADGVVPELKDLDIISEIKVSGVKSCADKSKGDDGKVTLTNQRLTGGKSKIISCEVDVGGITNVRDSAIKLTATYFYFVDSFTQITVLKTLE